MKLLRYGEINQEKPAIMDEEGKMRDLSSVIKDISSAQLTQSNLNLIKSLSLNELPLVKNNPRLGAPIGDVGKFICIGLNYLDHILETGAKQPKEPVVFSKFSSAICGPYDEIHIPKGSKHLDWEVELGVVIGERALNVSVENALSHVAGYCLINDISERRFQREMAGQWIKGKSYQTFAPIGPWLLTKDEVANPHNLSIWLKVDGQLKQDSNTKQMIFKVPYLVSYLSQFFALCPGDIISTGTPAGVGLGAKPEPVFLKKGQRLQFGIDKLGEQTHLLVQD
ncbi:MAG: fumarylacetoacetate hydrolase family protein [SAR324 cluster bacterium]|nr:fumarylacetoacetate hydrolase family protein [SAR324 cluster bacterium]